MKNYIQPGKTLTVPAPTGGVVSGDPVLVGAALFGVAAHTAAEAADVEIRTSGVFDLPKATGTAWAIGDLLYWDATGKVLTKTSVGNQQVAVAIAAAAAADAIGRAKLNEDGARPA